MLAPLALADPERDDEPCETCDSALRVELPPLRSLDRMPSAARAASELFRLPADRAPSDAPADLLCTPSSEGKYGFFFSDTGPSRDGATSDTLPADDVDVDASDADREVERDDPDADCEAELDASDADCDDEVDRDASDADCEVDSDAVEADCEVDSDTAETDCDVDRDESEADCEVDWEVDRDVSEADRGVDSDPDTSDVDRDASDTDCEVDCDEPDADCDTSDTDADCDVLEVDREVDRDASESDCEVERDGSEADREVDRDESDTDCELERCVDDPDTVLRDASEPKDADRDWERDASEERAVLVLLPGRASNGCRSLNAFTKLSLNCFLRIFDGGRSPRGARLTDCPPYASRTRCMLPPRIVARPRSTRSDRSSAERAGRTFGPTFGRGSTFSPARFSGELLLSSPAALRCAASRRL